jgi:hypothetical protein
MAEQGGGGSSVKIVAIIAVVVLVGVALWFYKGQTPRPAATSAPPAVEKKSDIEVKVDLPDSVTIKP